MPESKSPAAANGRAFGQDQGLACPEPSKYMSEKADASVSRKADALRLERRLEARRKGKKAYPIAALRLRDLKKIIAHRYVKLISDTRDGRALIVAVANHYAALRCSRDPLNLIERFVLDFAPWMKSVDIEALCFGRSNSMPSADNLARMISLDYATRTELGITTIGACDFPKSWREKQRKDNDRARSAQRRRLAGATPHADSLLRTRPWEAVGVSRATYYRNQRRYGDAKGKSTSRKLRLEVQHGCSLQAQHDPA